MIEKQEYLAKVNAAIEANYQSGDFGVNNLARILCISRSQLHRKIKAASSISVSAYINEFRLKKAYSLLQHGSMTASEVAYEVGFSLVAFIIVPKLVISNLLLQSSILTRLGKMGHHFMI